jgi:hypothetical protein
MTTGHSVFGPPADWSSWWTYQPDGTKRSIGPPWSAVDNNNGDSAVITINGGYLCFWARLVRRVAPVSSVTGIPGAVHGVAEVRARANGREMGAKGPGEKVGVASCPTLTMEVAA